MGTSCFDLSADEGLQRSRKMTWSPGLGGDEFVIVIDRVAGQSDASRIADRLSTTGYEPFTCVAGERARGRHGGIRSDVWVAGHPRRPALGGPRHAGRGLVPATSAL